MIDFDQNFYPFTWVTISLTILSIVSSGILYLSPPPSKSKYINSGSFHMVSNSKFSLSSMYWYTNSRFFSPYYLFMYTMNLSFGKYSGLILKFFLDFAEESPWLELLLSPDAVFKSFQRPEVRSCDIVFLTILSFSS